MSKLGFRSLRNRHLGKLRCSIAVPVVAAAAACKAVAVVVGQIAPIAVADFDTDEPGSDVD